MNEEKNISRTYDFSNVVMDTNLLTYLVKVSYDAYNRLLKTSEVESERNEKLKTEFKNYQYKKNYMSGLKIRMTTVDNELSSYEIKDLDHYNDLIKNGKINNLISFKIELNLSFERGTGYDLITHNNEIEISIKPYDIKVIRKSDYNDEGISNIENMIVSAFNEYTKVNTIFCSK